LKGHTTWVNDAVFSLDGKRILTASSDNSARLWDTETGKALAVLSGHTSSVHSARFSPDGRLIATAGDTTVRVWDGATGRAVTVIPVLAPGLTSSNGELSVRGASFSPDGKSLLAAGNDDTTRIYAWETFAPLEDLLALARTRITRDLTSEEKKKYLHLAADRNEPAARP
jgi:WD40 repeat protein